MTMCMSKIWNSKDVNDVNYLLDEFGHLLFLLKKRVFKNQNK